MKKNDGQGADFTVDFMKQLFNYTGYRIKIDMKHKHGLLFAAWSPSLYRVLVRGRVADAHENARRRPTLGKTLVATLLYRHRSALCPPLWASRCISPSFFNPNIPLCCVSNPLVTIDSN